MCASQRQSLSGRKPHSLGAAVRKRVEQRARSSAGPNPSWVPPEGPARFRTGLRSRAEARLLHVKPVLNVIIFLCREGRVPVPEEE